MEEDIKVQRKASIKGSGKNFIIAYLLWFFGGWLGFHNLYLGKPKMFLGQLVLLIVGFATSFIIIGYFFLGILIIWWLLDLYFIYKTIIRINQEAGVSNNPFQINIETQSDADNKLSESEKLNQLEKLHSLHEKGVLTEEEYQQKKSNLI